MKKHKGGYGAGAARRLCECRRGWAHKARGQAAGCPPPLDEAEPQAFWVLRSSYAVTSG